MKGYTIGDRKVAETLVEAGKTKPWCPQVRHVDQPAPVGIFLSAHLGRLTSTLDARTQRNGQPVPSHGTLQLLRQDGDDGPLKDLDTERDVWNFSESSFQSGDIVMALTDAHHRLYVLAGQGGESSVLCRITGGNTARGYSAMTYPDGKDGEPGDRVTLFVTELALGCDLPVGAWVIGHPAVAQVTEEGTSTWHG